MEVGITFADKWHTYRDWALELISVYIPMPSAKTQTIDLPGGDGCIDLTEQNGRPVYADREGIELTFYFIEKNRSAWFLSQSEFAQHIHGRKVKFVLDDEPDHFYMGRLSIDGKKSNPFIGQITMTGTAEPFKYDLQSSTEEWLWDSFNFETGVIRTLLDCVISAAVKTISVTGGSGIDTPPVFVVTEANNLSLVHKGRTYSLKLGKNRFPAVKVGGQDEILTFTGTGKLSIECRGRYL